MYQELFHIPGWFILGALLAIEIALIAGAIAWSAYKKTFVWNPLVFALVLEFFRRWLAPRIGPELAIYGYGVMMVVGFLLAVQWASFLARRSGLNPEVLTNAAIIALVTGIIGARLSHVLENWSQYTSGSFGENLAAMVNIRSGGLTYYGGFLLATPATIAYGMYKKFPIRLGMDIIAPCLMIGLGMGRVGCFLNGCCYGAECNVSWAVQFPYDSNAYVEEFEKGKLQQPPGNELRKYVPGSDGLPREILKTKQEIAGDPLLVAAAKQLHSNPVHPAQLYSTITALILAALLSAYYTFPHAPGRVFALMLMLEGATRFLLEMLRSEPPAFHTTGIFALWSLSMYIGVGLVLAGIVLWVVFGKFATKRFPPEFTASLTPSPAM